MPARVCLAILVFAIVAVYTVNLASAPLTERSEARYAGVSWEMLSSGDFLTPRYNGIKHFHKPPLFYWLTAASMKLLGPSEGAARLPCALAALATIALTGWLAARPSMGCSRPWLASGFLATAPFFWEMGRVVVTDMLVTLLVLVSLASAWQILDRGPSRGLLALFWASLGLNFLNKGPVGPLIVALVVLPYLGLGRGSWREFRPLPGLALAALLALPWYLWAAAKNPGLLAYLAKFQTADRVMSTVHKRTGPPWFYLPVLLAGFLPWTVWLFGALHAAWRKARESQSDTANPDLYLLLWLLPPALFFSSIGSKLPPYVLPLFPAMAILVARHHGAVVRRAGALPALLMVATGMAALTQAQWGFFPRGLRYTDELRWAGAWLLLSTGIGWLATRQSGQKTRAAALLISMLGLLLIAGSAVGKLSHLSAQPLAQAIRRQTRGPFEVAMYQHYLFGLPYYLGQRVVHVEHPRETQFESDSNQRSFLYSDLDAYRPIFQRGDKDRFLIAAAQETSRLSALLADPVIYQDESYVIFKHPGEHR